MEVLATEKLAWALQRSDHFMLLGEFELGNFEKMEITEKNIIEKKYSDLNNPGMRTI